jgi:hypothetical protein
MGGGETHSSPHHRGKKPHPPKQNQGVWTVSIGRSKGMFKRRKRAIKISIFIIVATLMILAIRTYSYAEFEFKCPEYFSTDEERRKHLREFFDYCKEKHPDWSIKDFLKYRYEMLIKYNCQKTLENIRKNEPSKK